MSPSPRGSLQQDWLMEGPALGDNMQIVQICKYVHTSFDTPLPSVS